MDESTESYIMLLLADGNLPTGSFVASSALESYVKHGFFSSSSAPAPGSQPTSSPSLANQAVINFIRDSLETYARSALPFVSDAHIAVSNYRSSLFSGADDVLAKPSEAATLHRITQLDLLYENMTLNEVTRRASRAQGVALLTLFSKGFSTPSLPFLASCSSTPGDEDQGTNAYSLRKPAQRIEQFVDSLKLMVRRDEAHGHLPTCWGIITAALGLSLERSQNLHLFLHSRSLLSASIRLNTLGPYAAQQILLHIVKHIVVSQMEICKDLRTGLQPANGDDEDGEVMDDVDGPATTWPLGEILAARHDLQHSRIFNS